MADLYLGRIALATIDQEATPTEQIGSEVTNVGDGIAVGQRRAKGFTLNFLVQGFDEPDSVEIGNTMRRRLRSMVQNVDYRLSGIYMRFGPDPERNGWLIIGTADLQDADGGVMFGNYKLVLSQVFLIAQIHTHREGFYQDLVDRTLDTSPIDYLGEVIGAAAGFAGIPKLALAALPVDAQDLETQDNPPAPVGLRDSRDGHFPVAVDVPDGWVITFDRNEGSMNLGDVVAYDRRGVFTAPAHGPDPAWQEAHGHDFRWNWTT